MRYTDEERRFMREYVPGHTYKEIREEFTRRFREISTGQVKSFVGNNHLNTGMNGRFHGGRIPWNKGVHTGHTSPDTEFKTGHMPHNHKPVGTEIIDSYGYIKVKVAEPKTWRFKHHLVWERHYGQIPKGYIVTFRDGNRLNTDIGNLALISRAVHVRMNQYGISKSADACDTALLVVKIAQERSEWKKKGKSK